MARLAIVIFVLIILNVGKASAQLIVNVENSRIQTDTTGWAGDIGTSFSYTSNVQQVLNINARAHVQYKSEKDLYLLLANYNFLKGNNQQLFNNMFFHLRYNRKLGKVVRLEAFSQLQQNKITNIESRTLLGVGPRFKVRDKPKLKIYAGVLAMYESEVDINPREVHKDLRSDNYLSFTVKPSEVFSITSTTFYQPLFRKFSDFRVLNQLSLIVKATKRFSISINSDYSYDAAPALGTPQINYTITNGFMYTF